MTDKEVGFTGRYNECWDMLTRPDGFIYDMNEGTIYDMNLYLKQTHDGATFKD